jgi:hypothetical protein
MDFLKKVLKPMDVIILVVGIVLLVQMDYSNMSLPDEAFLVCMVIWLGMLAAKLRIEWKRRQ